MLKKVLLTAVFAVSFGITQAQTTDHVALVTAEMNPATQEAAEASATKQTTTFYDRIPGIGNLIGFAKKHLAIRYRSGGTTPSGFDCSGFTRFCYSHFGINLPHSSSAQGNVGLKVEKESAMPGDLIFFKGHSAGGSSIGHVGLITEVVGNQIKFIHSAWGGGIRFDYLHADYYRNRFMGIRRVGHLLAQK
ncbi:C40 family peptidase [Fibrella aquatilis]|uniref:C40 family peptidase n=1 Tax=Fibrella aquatilis TaxID=2817059 RepID=A0A939G3H0_9BACT|nr:C40 family peptidase [Fibrella aquatilis]MBO0931201.1 C40 family peptidase [Fibrella aquatilis]